MTNWIYVPKEPTKEMIKAGEKWSALPTATWSDMIDEVVESDEDQAASFIQEAYNQGFRDASKSQMNGEFYMVMRMGKATFMVYSDRALAVEEAKKLNLELGSLLYMAVTLRINQP